MMIRTNFSDTLTTAGSFTILESEPPSNRVVSHHVFAPESPTSTGFPL